MIAPAAGDMSDDPRVRRLLDERTAALARRGIDIARHAVTRPFLVCAAGDDRYGLPLDSVVQVVPARTYTPVPGAPPELLGLIALSGRVVSVLSLAGALSRPASSRTDSSRAESSRAESSRAESSTATGHILVLRGGIAPVALAVDRVLAVAEVDGALTAEPVPMGGLGADAVSGYAPAPGPEAAYQGGEAGFVVIDLPRLLRRYLPQG
ncbi:chemotaxis protein CheW [Methylobacterium sp. W2]|uniref:chemotaxis protein CheW n=1 Tax=Methylobacterium sp. W2 TaxID=2598107 RepID=UPI001D0C1D1F|nr:chemotaxis protein CheW [Methylobacterium sp. W2]MCC0805144.1 chemotaxis protein CheW [Methylobacterium sp. W2]